VRRAAELRDWLIKEYQPNLLGRPIYPRHKRIIRHSASGPVGVRVVVIVAVSVTAVRRRCVHASRLCELHSRSAAAAAAAIAVAKASDEDGDAERVIAVLASCQRLLVADNRVRTATALVSPPLRQR